MPQLTACYCTPVAYWRRLEETTPDSLFSHQFTSETSDLHAFFTVNSCKCGVRLHLEEFLFITMSIEHRYFHATKLNPHFTLYVKPYIIDQVYRIPLYELHFDIFMASLVSELREIILSGSSESILPCGNTCCPRVSSSRRQKFQSRLSVVFA